MKTVSNTSIAQTGTTQWPVCKVECYKTPFPAPSFGLNLEIWRNIDATGEPYVGSPIDADYDPFSSMVRSHAWEFLGNTKRPAGIPVTEDCLVRWEGYFQVPTGVSSVDFKVLANPVGKLYLGADASSYPSGLSSPDITNTAATNADELSGAEDTFAWSAGSWHTLRFDWPINKGAYAKAVVLWKPTTETDWRLLDCSSVNTEAAWMVPDATGLATADAALLPGVLAVSADYSVDSITSCDIDIAKVVAPESYEHVAAQDSYGFLKAGRMVKVYGGYNVTANDPDIDPDSWVDLGTYFINNIIYNRDDASDLFQVKSYDARKKAADTPNIAYPDIIDHDVAGISSNTVYLEPDGQTRWAAYDSWYLNQAVRGILYKAGFTSEQLWAKDANGDYKIEGGDVRLNRAATYKLRLPKDVKESDLLYSFKPGMPLLEMVKQLVEDHGYEFGVDDSNEVYLRRAYNPNQYAADHATITYTSGTWNQVVDIDSLGATYETLASATGVVDIAPTESFSGLNLVIDRQTSAGTITVSVDGTPVSGWSSYDISYDKSWSYRDGYDPTTGLNPCVLEIERGLDYTTHTISITATGAARLAGYEVYQRDRKLVNFTFLESRINKLSVENTHENVRNDVIVVGRKEYDIDEFVMGRAIDFLSIYNPGHPSYVGCEKTFILPNDHIIRKDVVDYLALGLLKRYKTLQDNVSHDFPALPHLELGDCIKVTSSEAGISSDYFWVSRMGWKLSEGAGVFVQNVALSSYEPQPSFQPLLEPSDTVRSLAGGSVVSFQFSRTDGLSIDPDDHTSNEWNSYLGPQAGFYSGMFADDNPPVYVQIDFELLDSSVCTLYVKNLLTGDTMAVLIQEKELDAGKHTFLWNGRWYTPDQKSYTYAPCKPGWTEKQLKDYFYQKDPITETAVGENLNDPSMFWTGAGYFTVELVYKPLYAPTRRNVVNAKNASDTTKSFGKVLHLRNTTVYSYTMATPTVGVSGVPFGGRYDVQSDYYVASGGPPGIKSQLITGDYLVKAVFKGTLDCHLLLTKGTTLAVGDVYAAWKHEIQPDAFAAGSFLYNVISTSPWSLQNIIGETDFLAANSTNTFIIDPVGLPLTPSVDTTQSQIAGIKEGKLGLSFVFQKPTNFNYNFDRSVGYRDDYLAYFTSVFPGYYVNVGWYFTLTVDLINKAGLVVKTNIPYSYRLESPTYISGYKHCVFPDGPGISAALEGDYANARSHTPGGERKVHFTAAQSTNYCYDL
jgi:hypothetical protein